MMEADGESQPTAPQRIASIDVLRGLTILVMIFVNDVAGVTDVPAWMKHVDPSDADGMTFVDVVFPAFLFIVGMSIPLAIGKRLRDGESMLRVEGHILLRVLGLLVIGVFMVNEDGMTSDGHLPRSVWILLVYAGILLVWNRSSPSTEFRRKFTIGRRIAGAVLLAAMAILYRGDGEVSLVEIRPQWWGIIGLIGWAYLVAANVYLVARNRIGALLAAMALLFCVNFADNVGHFPDVWLLQYVDLASSLGSQAAIVVGGTIAGVVLSRESSIQGSAERIRWGLMYGAGLALAGHLIHALADVHDMFFINKINATVPWCLWCSAITIWIWVAVYLIVDVFGWKRWTVVIAPAGQNPLFAYILVPILYALFDLWELTTGRSPFYWSLGEQFSTGVIRSVALAFAVVLIAGGLRRIGVQPKL